MEKLSEARLSKILPQNLLADEKIAATAAALDKMLSDLTGDVKQVLHLPRLNELEGTILDLLAWQLHLDFYEPLWLSDEVKRNLIRESIAWHRQLGTCAALEKVLTAFNREIRIKEWFEYGGLPYHFKLYTNGFKRDEDFTALARMVNHVKNVRSWCLFTVWNEKKAAAYVGIGTFKHGRKRRLMTSAYEIGRPTRITDGERTLIIASTYVINCEWQSGIWYCV